MLFEERGLSYSSEEKPFIEYFDRLRVIGMSFDGIEKSLPQLDKYYEKMVVEEDEEELIEDEFVEEIK